MRTRRSKVPEVFGLMAVFLMAGLVTGCPSDREPDQRLLEALDHDRERLVHRVLGERFPDGAVLVRVGDLDVTPLLLAMYLELLPGLTIEQALDDLEDILILMQSLDQDSMEEQASVVEGRARGGAHVWLRAVASHARMELDEVSEVDRILESPEFAGRGGLVPMARVSHVLVEHSDDEPSVEGLRSVLNELSAELVAREQPVTHEMLVQAVSQWRDDPRLEGRALRAEGPFNIVPDNRMITPTVSAVAVVPEFSEAAFAQQEGLPGPPVVTRFGTHVIVVHVHEAAVPFADERRRELALRLALAVAEDNELGQRLGELRRGARVTVDSEAMELLTVSPAERLRREREEVVQGGGRATP